MHFSVILRVIGILLTLFSLTMLTPIPFALWFGEDTWQTFTIAFAITAATGAMLWLPFNKAGDLRARDGFMITSLFYVGLGLFGALPFFLPGSPDASFTDAAFESISGLTTTGATVLVGLDELPKSILFYRQQLQWLGGMGFIVLGVAILPMLGIGGMQLYRAEAPGPGKDNKLTPRIKETAKALWYIYLALTTACALAFWFGGMDWFDAIAHAFSTVAIGGYSTHDLSIGYFDSVMIEAICIVFMILSGINFALHFSVWNRRNPLLYLRDPEVRFYLSTLFMVGALVVWALVSASGAELGDAFRRGIFQTISLATTTGFTTDNFSVWPTFAPVLLILAAVAGGCAGSTAGGLKIMRVLLIYLQGMRELKRLIHPNAVFRVKLGHDVVPDRVIDAVWGFFCVYVMMFLLFWVITMGLGLDFKTAFSATAASLNNLGPGLGEVALNYAGLSNATKWVLMLAMIMGRLEIFTVLVLLTPSFWKH